MSDRGPEKAATPREIFAHMKSYDRPVWTASSLADELGVSRPTIQDRLEEVEETPRVRTMQVGNTKAYYVSEEDPRAIGEQHKDSIIDEFTDKFVGLPTAPETAVHPNDGPAEAGDKLQLAVEGVPGDWKRVAAYPWERRTEEFHQDRVSDQTQALISGELYGKPTAPIAHREIPDDYDLERKTGAEYKEFDEAPHPVLIASGAKNYLLKPHNNAVFLKNVSVDQIWPKEAGDDFDPETVDGGIL